MSDSTVKDHKISDLSCSASYRDLEKRAPVEGAHKVKTLDVGFDNV